MDSGYTYDDEDLPSVQCSMCGTCFDSVKHRTFFCPATQNELLRCYSGSNHGSARSLALVDQAKSDLCGDRALLGLWTRGLIPTFTLPTIDRATGQLRREGDLDALYQSVEFYSDSTVGPYGKYSNLAVGDGGGAP